MDYGVPLGLGLLGIAIIAFVLWEMFRRQPPACELAWKGRELSAADKARNEEMLVEFRAHKPAETATTIIGLPEGKTLDDVCAEPWQRALDAELVAYKRLREMG